MRTKINEQQLLNAINKSIKKNLNEFFYFSNNGENGETSSNVQTGDMSANEPSDFEIKQALFDIQKLCEKYGLKFKDLGNREFGATCKIGENGKATCDIGSFLKEMKFFIDQKMLKTVEGGISKNGTWYKKYRILKVH